MTYILPPHPTSAQIAEAIWTDPHAESVGFRTRDGHHVNYADGRMEPISEQIYRQVLLLSAEGDIR